jgi:hypothetical protein
MIFNRKIEESLDRTILTACDSVGVTVCKEELMKALAYDRDQYQKGYQDASPKWISVEDRLPENGKDVLCWYEYYRYGEYNAMYRTQGIGFCVNGHWGGEAASGHRAKVLYWMPLPEPPKEEACNLKM